ncbi:MAG: DUF3427 domain-containing protein [Spirochaetales bacterium]|jgi:superfamily II DNA or RNA helicase|nr:DUF3427 domain-containing protein [Spirochaetales bacterium]
MENLSSFEKAIKAEKSQDFSDLTDISFFDLRPYGFQQVILDEISAERKAGKHKHLIISATGTGKTMVAAFDYRNYCGNSSNRPRMLFIAHREEILKQAQATFRQVLRDGSFGQLLVGGEKPDCLDHLFCTVKSWNSRKLQNLTPEHYDYVVLDEAHHAAASSYQKLISHIKPDSLLGLTATPERSDGIDIRRDFDGSFTHELRLPEAVERALLSPFHYYGIPDYVQIDFSKLSWKRGRYDSLELQDLLNSHDGRAEWVLSQTDSYVADIHHVRALGFCVSVQHAVFMAEKFNRAGIPSEALSGHTKKEIRTDIHRKLERREINFVFAVDLYNEGIDIPVIDTVLFLRPTESLTLFLQQLGRGLRLHPEKAQLTVLDFIAPQHEQFDFIARYRALSRRPERRIDQQIEHDMPFVPAGCFVQLERQAKNYVLDHIKNSTNALRRKQFLQNLENLVKQGGKELSLQKLLDYFHLDSPDPVYKLGLPHQLVLDASHEQAAEPDLTEKYKLNTGLRKLLLMDDTDLLQRFQDMLEAKEGWSGNREVKIMLHSLLWGKYKSGGGTLDEVHSFFMTNPGLLQDLIELLSWMLQHKTPVVSKQFSRTGLLVLHASYTREQILFAAGKGTFERPAVTQSGVLHIPERRLDIFFADINKNEADFSPTTMYQDYAVTDTLFHWQSQSVTGRHSPTGRRYINHQREGYTPLLFIREQRKAPNGITAPYLFAGPLRYRSHEGTKPISFLWELENALPERVLSWARRVS